MHAMFGIETRALAALGLLCGLLSAASLADEARTPVGKPWAHERAGDEQIVVPGRAVAPARPVRVIKRGGYEAVQVNVDALGLNIIDDAANEPSLAINPQDPNQIVIVWRQFDTIASNFRQAGYAYSHDGGETWTFPGVLDPGVFRSDPVVDVDAEGNFYYMSLGEDFDCSLFKSTDGGVTWGEPAFAYGGDKEWMVIDRTGGIGRGNIYVCWQVSGSCCGYRTFTRSTDGGATFQYPVEPLHNPHFGTMAVGPDGVVYVAGESVTGWDHMLGRTADAQDSSITPTFSAHEVPLGGRMFYGGQPNPDGLLGQAYVSVDCSDGPSHGNVYYLCTVEPDEGDDPADVRFTRSSDSGVSWTPSVRINNDPEENGAWQWFGTMAIAPNGRLDVIWNDTRNTGEYRLCETFYAYSLDGGDTWLGNVPVTPAWNSRVGWPNQAKIGDYYQIVSDDTYANVAFAATFNGEQDVYFARLGDCNGNGIHDGLDVTVYGAPDADGNGIPDECDPDCNGNGVPDPQDIAGGASTDYNGNWIPDDCEPDCNENGVPDDWDIATGVSHDCNANDVLDECDLRDGTSLDCNNTGIPDECELYHNDCNHNLVPDDCDLANGTSQDCNGSGVPDECELGANDCNWNSMPDDCDIADGTSEDCNGNGMPDECEGQYAEITTLVRIGRSNRFGNDVAVAQNIAAIGAPHSWAAGVHSGALYISRFDGCDWGELTRLIPIDCAASDYFGASVDITDSRAVAGATGHSTNGVQTGAAFVFRQTEAGWVEEATLTPGDSECRSAGMVAMSDDIVILGARKTASDRGRAYVYRRTGECWTEEQTLGDPNGVPGDGFGAAIGLDGNTAVVGTYSGEAAYVFDYDGSQWNLSAKLQASDGVDGDSFGRDVVICNDTICVGAWQRASSGGIPAGAVYVFRRDGTNWTQQCMLMPPDPDDEDQYGMTLTLSTDRLIVGAPAVSKAYVYERHGEQWPLRYVLSLGYLREFAAGLALLGDTLVIGEPTSSTAHIYDLRASDCNRNGIHDQCEVLADLPDCNGNKVPDECELPCSDCDGNGIPDDCDIAVGTSSDCNANGTPDQCDITDGTSTDTNNNGIPDECDIFGDLDCDGIADVSDIGAFVMAILFPAQYEVEYPDCDLTLADCNGDGCADVFDIDAFIAVILGGR